ncbi:MAG TPA: S41 family peptidase [Gammaproteobacteria bacterium]|nr:S41 family peptidase [Gammaproteobacteria bacterium]
MKFTKQGLLLVLSGAILGVSLSLTHTVFAERENASAQAGLPLTQLREFTNVYARIKKDYVEPVSDNTLMQDAIRGMMAGLDPHSAYLDKRQFKELQVGTTGQFGGLGIEVGMEDGFIKVVSPIDDTPAQRAGIKSGDLIIRLDDTPVKGMTLNDAVNRMRGKPGTKITLTVVREGAQKPLKFTLTRAIIHVKSVKSRMLEPGYGYVRISQFQAKTGNAVVDAVDKLKKEAGGSLKGLVLDLRNNPGGVLNAAVAVSDAFIKKGLIVYTKGRVPDSRLRFSATPGDILHGAPMVVLVNQGSASASEIVSGALQDHHRAIIMGQQTFGKGSVQTIVPLGNGTAIKLTTARYYTPSGRSIQAEGITPDVRLEPAKVAAANNGEVIKEADLTGHLVNGNAKKNAGREAASAADTSKEKKLAASDFELYQALNMLRGLHIQREVLK